MQLRPTLPPYEYCFKTIDSHTMGEPTRIIYDGFPPLQGESMMDKKQQLVNQYDHLRRALMLEPRGHRDMFGALLTEPCHPLADLGVIFMESGGYLNMCGHGSMGVCAMAVETGLVQVSEPYTCLTLDTPAGLIEGKVEVKEGRVQQVSIRNVPAFVYRDRDSVLLKDGSSIEYALSFGGSFFALVDADKLGLALEPKNSERLTALGMELLEAVNRKGGIQHPVLDIHSVDLVEFYSGKCSPGASSRNCVIFGQGQIDRSPCGTGTSAKLAYLYKKGMLAMGEDFVYESITGSRFTGRVLGETKVGDYLAIVPQISGNAYLIGMNQWLISREDPLALGFLL